MVFGGCKGGSAVPLLSLWFAFTVIGKEREESRAGRGLRMDVFAGGCGRTWQSGEWK